MFARASTDRMSRSLAKRDLGRDSFGLLIIFKSTNLTLCRLLSKKDDYVWSTVAAIIRYHNALWKTIARMRIVSRD